MLIHLNLVGIIFPKHIWNEITCANWFCMHPITLFVTGCRYLWAKTSRHACKWFYDLQMMTCDQNPGSTSTCGQPLSLVVWPEELGKYLCFRFVYNCGHKHQDMFSLWINDFTIGKWRLAKTWPPHEDSRSVRLHWRAEKRSKILFELLPKSCAQTIFTASDSRFKCMALNQITASCRCSE